MTHKQSLIALVTAALLLPLSAVSVHATIRPEAQAELQKDQVGAHDLAPAGRYEGAHMLAQTIKAFDELKLPAGPTAKDAANPSPHFVTVVTGRGRVTRTLYIAPPGRSTLEIVTNHEDALKAAGFEVLFECGGDSCGDQFGRLKYNGENANQRIVVDKAGQTRAYLTDAMLEYVKDVRYALLKKSGTNGDTYVGIYVAQMTGGSHGDSSDAFRLGRYTDRGR